MINTFVLMGLPGSGKGKQADFLSQRTGFVICDTGDELRKLAAENNDLGRKVVKVLNSGDLLPHWFGSHFFIARLLGLSSDDGILFEGVGRRELEARLFAEACEWLGRDFRVLHVKVSEVSVAERLRKRQEIEGRKDDDPLVFQNRLKNFYEHTAPAIEYFRSINKVIDIDGEPLPDAVFAEVWQKVSVL